MQKRLNKIKSYFTEELIINYIIFYYTSATSLLKLVLRIKKRDERQIFIVLFPPGYTLNQCNNNIKYNKAYYI